jgi:hypothetical protein
MFESARKKNEQFHKAIVSEEKKKYFESVRKRLLDAQRNQIIAEEHEAEMELMRMFNSREEYEHTMRLYEEYEQDMHRYLEYLEYLEEESNNFQKMQMEAEIKRKNQVFEEMFNDE